MSPRPARAVVPTRVFQAIAAVGLLPAGLVAHRFGPGIGEALGALEPDLPTGRWVLGHVIAALLALVPWMVVLAPLRARSELGPLWRDWDEIRHRGRATLREEWQRLEASAVSDDPAVRRRYYGRMAVAGVGMTAVFWLIGWIAHSDGVMGLECLLACLVAPAIAVWYGVRYVVLVVLARLGLG